MFLEGGIWITLVAHPDVLQALTLQVMYSSLPALVSFLLLLT